MISINIFWLYFKIKFTMIVLNRKSDIKNLKSFLALDLYLCFENLIK
jgi:hypothetical protein